MSNPFQLLLSAAAVLLFQATVVTATGNNVPKRDLVRASCVHASYPDICFRSLSAYGGSAATPRDLALAGVRISLGRVKKASDFLSQLKGTGHREQGALSDCLEQMGDSMEELRKTLVALQGVRRGADFRWQMSNAETWVSAALTNEETCMDGFREINGRVRVDVKQKVTDVARVTSNALYLINLADESSVSP